VSGPDRDLVADVRAALLAAADPVRAPGMQAYMKSEMPFLGVGKPERTRLLRPLLAAWRPSDRGTWEASVRTLYDEAGFREERYAALALLISRAGRPWRDAELVPLVEHLVTEGAWWDLVDEVAGRTVAPLHRADPAALAPVVRRWAVHEDLWLRRTAILAQLGSGTATDTDLLAEVIAASADRPEFWLRKAIGWALRDLAHHDPGWVRGYLAAHGAALSPLSRREAAKHL
jgi:3-methyladenine DNA glycosylase AlkD